MLTAPVKYRQALHQNKRNYRERAEITLSNGTILKPNEANLWTGGFSVEEAVSDDNSFTALGSTIIGSATITLNNIDNAYSEYDFTNAKVKLYVALRDPDHPEMNLVEFRKGVYSVDDASYTGSTIVLSLLDNMAQFDRPYRSSALRYPATLSEIVRDACLNCGVPNGAVTFPRGATSIGKRPDDEAITFREVIGWAAAIAGCYAKCDSQGFLRFNWFDTDSLESVMKGIDGGRFDTNKPYATGDRAEGGNFNPWSNPSAIDGALFTENLGVHVLSSLYSQDIGIDDIVITGIRIFVEHKTNEGKTTTETYKAGSDGYTIDIKGNRLVTPSTAQDFANELGKKLIGSRFRKAKVTIANDPTIEAGDVAVLWDQKNNGHLIYVTRTEFSPDQTQVIICGGETPARNSSTRYSWQTKNQVLSDKKLNDAISAREAAIQNLTQKLSETSGLYSTIQTTSTGSKIFYLHDMPRLEESAVVWKMTTTAWGVTTNYNKGVNTVWNGGMTVDGDTIVRLLSAEGINADWISAGTLKSKRSNTSFNLSTGELTIDKGSIRLGGNFTVNSQGVLSAKNVTISGLSAENATISGTINNKNNSTFVSISDGKISMGDMAGQTKQTQGVLSSSSTVADAGYGILLEARSGELSLRSATHIEFRVKGYDRCATMDEYGLHVRNGTHFEIVYLPTDVKPDGTVKSYKRCVIVDGILKDHA